METKVCKCCGRELPVSDFRKTRLGIMATCNECIRQNQIKAKAEKKNRKNFEVEIEKARTARLSDFTPRELMAELKSRGFRWDKMQVTVVQEVDYNKI